LTSGAWRHGGRRVNWVRVAGVIYDKFDGEFASRSLTYASTGNVRYQCEVTSVIGSTFRTCRDFRVESAFGGKAEVGFRARQGQLLADIVAKVENRTTSKISQKLIFGRRGHCNTP
jgi:hypothetical protein